MKNKILISNADETQCAWVYLPINTNILNKELFKFGSSDLVWYISEYDLDIKLINLLPLLPKGLGSGIDVELLNSVITVASSLTNNQLAIIYNTVYSFPTIYHNYAGLVSAVQKMIPLFKDLNNLKESNNINYLGIDIIKSASIKEYANLLLK